MDCSIPGFPVLHHLLEFAHTHVHWVSDAIQKAERIYKLLKPNHVCVMDSNHRERGWSWVAMHESPQLRLCFCLVIKLQFHWCPLQECILCEQCEKVLGLNWKFALSLQLYDLLYSDLNSLSFWIIYGEEKELTKNEKKWISQCRNWKSVPRDRVWAQWNLKTLRPHPISEPDVSGRGW